MTDEGPVAVLPKEVTRLPRSQRIPDPKPETKWEKFAKEKGIKKTKKERMVWNEQTQQFAPRFGYKRVKGENSIEDVGFIEIKAGQDPYADPFAVEKNAKNSKKIKNLSQQIRNKDLNNHKKKNNNNNFDYGI